MATHANWLLDSYVYGLALQEASLPFDTAGELADMVRTSSCLSSPDEFPYLNESAAALVAAGYDPAEVHLRPRPRPSRPRAPESLPHSDAHGPSRGPLHRSSDP